MVYTVKKIRKRKEEVDIFDVLTLIGGLCLFLFGMNLMGAALEKRAGGSLKTILGKLTTGRMTGLLTGMGVTAVIQSSSATTVMVVGFVNSGLLTLSQAINVIMGANIGTTVTAWILSLTGIQGSSLFVQLLKPTSFTPILALLGLLLFMAGKSDKKKDTGTILLGFATLMFGMSTMSEAVAGLSDVPAFGNILLLFNNPILGVLAGALLTAIIQSSSASVGILQALAITGQVTYGAAIPIIMGQNIGTCVTALLASVGANKNAKRAAMVHLCFNIIGTIVWLSIFCLLNAVFNLHFMEEAATLPGIALAHTVFNVLCTALLLPCNKLLEKLACRIIPDDHNPMTAVELDERLLATPPIALERCRVTTEAMATVVSNCIKNASSQIFQYDSKAAATVREGEEAADHYEDILGSYLVKLSSKPLNEEDSREVAKFLHLIGDFERISDHAVNLIESAEEIKTKEIRFSQTAEKELSVIINAVREIMDLSISAFVNNDQKAALLVEPLEQVVDTLKEQLRTRHILRLQRGNCSIEAGFIWSDLLSNLERVADHCSNIAGCILETAQDRMDLHNYLDSRKKDSPEFISEYEAFAKKYALVQE